ncbi:hypothetical protein ZWY2020_035660 [Hordeum vulgare]|nr:hypothetical protein ZWY2020_035660 [Hordeum vulgare]
MNYLLVWEDYNLTMEYNSNASYWNVCWIRSVLVTSLPNTCLITDGGDMEHHFCAISTVTLRTEIIITSVTNVCRGKVLTAKEEPENITRSFAGAIPALPESQGEPGVRAGRLKSQDTKGAKPFAIERTMAAIRDLQTKLNISLAFVDAVFQEGYRHPRRRANAVARGAHLNVYVSVIVCSI